MLARRMWVFALLAAVFCMHGVPSMGTAGGSTSSAHSATSVVPETAAPASASAEVEHQTATSLAAATHLGSVGSSEPGHPTAAHLWATCLAVMLAGFVLLGAVVATLLRGQNTGLPRAPAAHRWLSRARAGPARPPDFFALCVLRT